MRFDLLRMKIFIIRTFGEQLLVKKNTVKIEKFNMAAKTGSDAKVETNSLIVFHGIQNNIVSFSADFDSLIRETVIIRQSVSLITV